MSLANKPLVALVGATAVGKSELALDLAVRLDGEIVSADSRLFYRGMDIGTAKPNLEERRRVPHHLIDVADPTESWSLAVFQEQARQAIAGIHARGKLPLLVGGTGQYLRAVTQGWQPPLAQPDPALRAALEHWAIQVGPDGLHARLAHLDLQAAQAIDQRNLRRTVRALEVIFTTGRRFSAQRGAGPSPYHLLQVGLTRPRPELYARIDARITAMLAAGLVEEIRGLLEQGYDPGLPSLSAIGYREIIQHLKGRISLEEAVVQIKRQTRVFVRRQANWFRLSDPEIHWFEMGEDTLNTVERFVRNWMAARGE